MGILGETVLVFDSSSECNVFIGSELPGVDFSGQVSLPLIAELPLSFTTGETTGIFDLTVIDMEGLIHTPFEIDGHSIEVLSTEIIAQDLQYDSVATIDNVFGRFTLEHEVLIDQTVQLRVEEDGDLGATFDALTGEWSDVELTTAFTISLSVVEIPVLDARLMGLFFLLLLATGVIILRRCFQPSVEGR